MAILQKKRTKNAQQTTLHPLKRSIMYQILSFCLKKQDLEFKMCLPTSATGSSECPGEVTEAQTVIKMVPNCSPISQEQIETLISKI